MTLMVHLELGHPNAGLLKIVGYLAERFNARVIVAGAYGHSRLREWVLGGVTHDLLLRAENFSLLSH